MGCNQHHPVAGIGAANIPGGVKANVASEIESAYRRTFLACIFHQSGKSMAPLRRCHAFQPIALHIPAAAIILCLHGVEIQAHEGKRDRKSTRLNSITNAHLVCRLLLEKKKKKNTQTKS